MRIAPMTHLRFVSIMKLYDRHMKQREQFQSLTSLIAKQEIQMFSAKLAPMVR